MPKLLDITALGKRPVPQPPSGVASYEPQSGESEIAESMVFLGDTITRMGEELTRARNASQLGESLSLATEEMNQLEFSLQRDPDFRTAPTRFSQAAEQIQKRHEESIDDPTVRETYRQRVRALAQAKHINVLQIAATKEGDHNVAQLNQSLDTYATATVNAANDAEAAMIVIEAQRNIERMQAAGWITAVDAGKKERAFLVKVDQATVTRDMATDPMGTAETLATDPTYAPNLDPVQRERWIYTSFQRAEAERLKRERELEKEQERIGEEALKQAFALQEQGTLTHEYVESIRPVLEPSEYKSLLKDLRGGADSDDTMAIEDIETLIYNDPAAARSLAFQYHREGRIQSESLQKYNALARSVSRTEGPRSPYERERSYISDNLKPSPLFPDPVQHARMAEALREFDDFALENQGNAQALREKASEVVKTYAMENMEKIVRRTGAGYRNSPEGQLEQIRNEVARLRQDRSAGRIAEDDYIKRMRELNGARAAAEKANEAATR